MTSVLTYIRPRKVAYARARGEHGFAAAEAWSRILGWLKAEGHKLPSVIGFGLMQDDPRKVPAELCRYDACVDMPDGAGGPLPRNIGTQLIPGGAYVLERHNGGCRDVLSAIESLCGECGPSNSIVVDRQRPIMEILHDDPSLVPEEKRRIDICVPVVVGEALSQEPAPQEAGDPPPLRLVVNS